MVIAVDTVVEVGNATLTAHDVVAVARGKVRVRLTDQARAQLAAERRTVDRLADSPTPVYGVSTGFGALATTHIPRERRADLQRSLIRSHAASTGREVDGEIVRAMMLLRLRTLASGRTGVRPETAAALAGLLDAGITPIIGERPGGGLRPLGAQIGRPERRIRGSSQATITSTIALARTTTMAR